MSNNLSLWQSVEKTPVEETKPITGKSYRGNSPKPHFIIKRATETFGPCGIGWGFEIVEEKIVDGQTYKDGSTEQMHYAKVRVWYMQGGQKGIVEHVGGTIFSGKRKSGDGYTDDDAPKKSVTDALIKALSLIGFAGDIFLGRYDDSKYMDELQQEARDKKREESGNGAKPTPKPKPQQPQATPFDDPPSDSVEWVSADGSKHKMEKTTAIARMWKAYDSNIVTASFQSLCLANDAWLKGTPDYAKLTERKVVGA